MSSIPLTLTWDYWRRVRAWYPMAIAIGILLPAFVFWMTTAQISGAGVAVDPETEVSLIFAFVMVNAFLLITLLNLTPGQDTVAEFFRVGVPLTICISQVSAWLAQYLWLQGPLLPTWLGG